MGCGNSLAMSARNDSTNLIAVAECALKSPSSSSQGSTVTNSKQLNDSRSASPSPMDNLSPCQSNRVPPSLCGEPGPLVKSPSCNTVTTAAGGTATESGPTTPVSPLTPVQSALLFGKTPSNLFRSGSINSLGGSGSPVRDSDSVHTLAPSEVPGTWSLYRDEMFSWTISYPKGWRVNSASLLGRRFEVKIKEPHTEAAVHVTMTRNNTKSNRGMISTEEFIRREMAAYQSMGLCCEVHVDTIQGHDVVCFVIEESHTHMEGYRVNGPNGAFTMEVLMTSRATTFAKYTMTFGRMIASLNLPWESV